MVEKRTFVFITLFVLVIVVLMSSFAAYLYLQNAMYIKQLTENQNSLDTMASAYNELMSKYNIIGSEYSILYGNYLFPMDGNFTSLMETLGRLIDDLKANYSSILLEHKDLNETYYVLLGEFQEIYKKGNEITREDFGQLLNKFYELLNLFSLRELSSIVCETVTLVVSIAIDYGNGTIEWHNGTKMPAGSSLFQLTQKVAIINYTYYAFSKPGHVLVNSINDKKAYAEPDFSEGWNWIWYQWDDAKREWIPGIVGSDGWMLEDGGIYKWRFEHWHWP